LLSSNFYLLRTQATKTAVNYFIFWTGGQEVYCTITPASLNIFPKTSPQQSNTIHLVLIPLTYNLDKKSEKLVKKLATDDVTDVTDKLLVNTFGSIGYIRSAFMLSVASMIASKKLT